MPFPRFLAAVALCVGVLVAASLGIELGTAETGVGVVRHGQLLHPKGPLSSQPSTVSHGIGYDYSNITSRMLFQDKHHRCVGRYCGRPMDQALNRITGLECGFCPQGTRTDGFVCVECENDIDSYGITYLVFQFSLVFCLHTVAFQRIIKNQTDKKIVQAVNIFEILLSALFSVVTYPPVGTLQLKSCGSQRISDWYTSMYNAEGYHCASEATFPMLTIILTSYGFMAAFTAFVRPIVLYKLKFSSGSPAIYASLYMYPILGLIQICLGGVIYYSFPYAICVIAVIWEIACFSHEEFEIYKNPKNLAFVVLRYLMNVFSILGILFSVGGAQDIYFTVPFLLPLLPHVLNVLFYSSSDPSYWS